MNISGWNKPDRRWYLGVACGKCLSPILFAVESSEGAHPAPMGKLVLTCSAAGCGHRADYTAAKLSRFQKSET